MLPSSSGIPIYIVTVLFKCTIMLSFAMCNKEILHFKTRLCKTFTLPYTPSKPVIMQPSPLQLCGLCPVDESTTYKHKTSDPVINR